MYESGACPECGAARKLPMSGCLDPETFFNIRNIKPKAAPAAPEQGAAPTGRPRPKAVAREWDIAVPAMNPVGGKKPAAGSGRGGARALAAAALIVIALIASVAAVTMKLADLDDGAAVQRLTVRAKGPSMTGLMD